MGKARLGTKVFTFTVLISLALTLVLRSRFGQAPPAAFGDFYLFGLLLVSYYCSWKRSVVLLAISTAFSIFLLRPLDWIDGFQIISYSVIASVVILIMALLKRPLPNASHLS